MTEQNSEQKNEWAERECGALWKKESPTQEYWSGHFVVADDNGVDKKVKVVIFTNKHKKKDSHPDFRVYKSADPSSYQQQQQQTTNETTGVSSASVVEGVVEEELI